MACMSRKNDTKKEYLTRTSSATKDKDTMAASVRAWRRVIVRRDVLCTERAPKGT